MPLIPLSPLTFGNYQSWIKLDRRPKALKMRSTRLATCEKKLLYVKLVGTLRGEPYLRIGKYVTQMQHAKNLTNSSLKKKIV